jgi:hypothetical protein
VIVNARKIHVQAKTFNEIKISKKIVFFSQKEKINPQKY